MVTPLTNWAGNVIFGAAAIHRPESLDELRELTRRTPRIRAIGSRHSFSRVADTDGDLVVLDGLEQRAVVDPGGTTVTVSAGMTYAQVVPVLHEAGRALSNMASLPHISVAGSVATGTHGSGRTQRSLAAAVCGLTLVTADGSVVRVSRDADGDRFAGFVVGLGALGIVTEVILRVEPAFQMYQLVRVGIEVGEAGKRLGEMFAAAYSVSLFTDFRSEAHAYLKIRTDQRYSGWEAGRAAQEAVHPVPGMPAEWCTQQLGVPGPWHERLPHFRAEFMPGAGDELQSEYFVPVDLAPAAFDALVKLGDLIASVVHCAEVRTVRGDDLWLSPVQGGDMVTFHFTWRIAAPEVPAVMRSVEEALRPFQARPHWAKLTAMPADEVVARYPRAADFAALRAELDPERKFGNDLIDALFPQSPSRPAGRRAESVPAEK